MKEYTFSALLAVFFVMSIAGVHEEVAAAEHKLSKILHVYNWEDYFGETTLSDFEKKFGVKVNLETFEDEEELVAGLQSHPEKYDVIITSDNSIRELIAMRLLARLDLNNIPNLKNIDPEFGNPPYDPGHKHSVPYLWGTTGLVVNRTFVKNKADSWSILWNPRYKGKIAMLNSPEEVVGAALKMLGHSLNTKDPSQLNKARERLLKQKPLVAGYLDAITIRDRLIENKLWAAQIYSGDGMAAADKNEALEYIIPKEGASVWIDCLAIPRDAHHKYTAEVFINYILEPDVSAQIANCLWYANCNRAARVYTLKEILESAPLYPPEDVVKRCEFFYPLGTDEEIKKNRQIVNKLWSELHSKVK